MPESRKAKLSAGILLFRRGSNSPLEVLLVHPGGPFWKNKPQGAWTIPKGEVEPGEDLLLAARREFSEETGLTLEGPFHPLGHIVQKGGKTVHAWACEGDAQPDQLRSNLIEVEWPRGSGRMQTFPEVDQYAWLNPELARHHINPAQAEFLDRLLTQINSPAAPDPP
jgi:predicted NUDIX family NTP pyrophosphohydrolase